MEIHILVVCLLFLTKIIEFSLAEEALSKRALQISSVLTADFSDRPRCFEAAGPAQL